MPDFEKLQKLCQLVRYDILSSTTAAGSGHATSSLSAVELMTTLFFAGFLRYDLEHPENPANDRIIFSKGHASPLLYSLYQAAGAVSSEELMTLRQFNSVLEGHPTPRFKYVDVATGSLGQGLSVGVGMALGLKLKLEVRGEKLENDVGSERKNISHHTSKIQLPTSHVVPRVLILLGDSEMSEGQVWEAMQIASYYKLDNLIAIVDVNRLGQRGETMLGWDVETYAKRVEAFGWEVITVNDGHDLNKIHKAFEEALKWEVARLPARQGSEKLDNEVRNENFNPTSHFSNPASNLALLTSNKPTMIFAKTVKGKGISFLEDKNGWHGKALSKDQLQAALKELGEVDLNIRGTIQKPKKLEDRSEKLDDEVRNENLNPTSHLNNPASHLSLPISYRKDEMVSTREAYGDALVSLGETDQRVVVLDAEVSNSTYTEKFAKKFPDRFFEMFIAEQNMVSTALGLAKIGFMPFASSFAAFLTRAFDQIRMSQYSYHLSDGRMQDGNGLNLKIVGSHSGVSIGSDGPSQMALEDLAMMRSILNSTVFYPSDGISAFKLTQIMAKTDGVFYMRTTRNPTAIIYKAEDEFKIGGSKILRQSPDDKAVVFAVGITVHEALKAYEELKKEQISLCVVDLYSIKPIDHVTIQQLARKIRNIIVVEDHYPYGGLGEAVLSALLKQTVDDRGLKIDIEDRRSTIDNHNLSSNFHPQDPSSTLNPLSSIGFNFIHLSVQKLPHSGSPQELLSFEQIDSSAIVKRVKEIIKSA